MTKQTLLFENLSFNTHPALVTEKYDGCMAMLNVYTDKNHRLKGYARKACENLLNEAVKFGAHTAYLQVVADNGPAYHIYDSLGYKKIYTYRYKEK